jgi:hypothetical protein
MVDASSSCASRLRTFALVAMALMSLNARAVRGSPAPVE